MLRILVISDSHGASYSIRSAVMRQPSAKAVYFLGDGEYDLDILGSLIRDIPVIKVKGNCDYGSTLPTFAVDEVEGKRIYCTHGYLENVKYTMDGLIERAADNRADIVLYGHTHISDTAYKDGVWYINPGSLRNGSYAVVDISSKGILPTLMHL